MVTVWVGTYDVGLFGPVPRGSVSKNCRPIWVNPHGLIPWGKGSPVATLGDGLLRVAHDGRIERMRAYQVRM